MTSKREECYTTVEETKFARRRQWRDRGLRVLLWTSAGLVCGLLLFLIGTIFLRGLPQISWKFLTAQPSVLKGTIGILPNVINTVVLVVGTLLLALPVGIGAAVYLNEYAPPGRLVRLIEFATEVLTGIPSILYGFIGMMFFVQALKWGSSLRAGICTLAIMILPTVVRNTQEALRTVPASYREAALGLGSGKWHMIRTVVLPSAVDGIVTGCILAIGRIVGESAALLYTAGSVSVLVRGVGKLLKTSGGSLTVALYMYAMERGEIEVGFAIASILMLLTLLLNLSTKWVGKKLKH